MSVILRFALIVMVFVASIAHAQTSAWPGRIQAVRTDWNVQAPPDDGWVEVTLPDDWSTRWPQFDGVVWYRLTWNVAEPVAKTGLFIEYLNMAGVVTVNGAELVRDMSLTEPLSRAWNTPHYFELSPPLLHAGENTLLLRVSGLFAYQPGLGPVHLASPTAMRAAYQREHWLRYDLQLVSITICITLGLFFLMLWLFRRREVAYGWYSAQQFAWLIVAFNQVATTTWPFASTDVYEAVNTVALLVFEGTFFMFVLRFFDRHWPRREATMWISVAAGCLWVLSASHAAIGDVRALLTLLQTFVFVMNSALLMYFAWREGHIHQRFLAMCAGLSMYGGVHDMLAFLRVIDSNIYYASLGAQINAIGMAVVLAWNFVRSLHRIEGFNAELQQGIDEARGELAMTLARQHELELVHARLGERVSLAHDLHDGLGGMLIGNIAALEQSSEALPADKVLDMFRELRDDLRLIIDTASIQQYGELSLTKLLAPLRHRMTRLFESNDIALLWRIGNLEDLRLTTTQSLDLLRILQEALTNVFKHARACNVDVELSCDACTLLLEVRDDGHGLAVPNERSGTGTGMHSMQTRARRLGATLSVGSEPGATIVRLHMMLPDWELRTHEPGQQILCLDGVLNHS